MINEYTPELGDYVRHRFDKSIKGIVRVYDESGTVVYIDLHDSIIKNFKVFVDNLEPDKETYREHKIKNLL